MPTRNKSRSMRRLRFSSPMNRKVKSLTLRRKSLSRRSPKRYSIPTYLTRSPKRSVRRSVRRSPKRTQRRSPKRTQRRSPKTQRKVPNSVMNLLMSPKYVRKPVTFSRGNRSHELYPALTNW